MIQPEAPAPMTLHRAHAPAILQAVLLAVLLCLVPGVRAQQGSVATDRAALQALYDATDGANWEDSTSWSTAAALSEWFGVTTNGDGRVTGLAVSGNRLRGTLPAALGNLTRLEQLDLRDNGLNGPMPTELENLDRLESLQLEGNYALTGPLPNGVRQLSRLETVQIERTELCVTDNGTLQAWLESVSFTGLVCPPAEQSVIDVAVFYTPAARMVAVMGHLYIETEIALMAAETNTAYRNSGANQRINLVAVEEVAGYTQSVDDSRGHYIDHERLRSPSDGYMDEIHEIRDAVAADIVMLVRWGRVSSAAQLGPPYLPNSGDQAFGVVSTSSFPNPSLSLVLAHELGHLMGLFHDRFAECRNDRGPSCTATPFPYSFGYVNQRLFDPNDPPSPNPDPTVPPTAQWRTIMAYNLRCWSLPGRRCAWLPRFSNPDQFHPDPSGDPLGKAGLEPSPAVDGPSDTARMLNRTRGYVANLRSPPDITASFAAGPYTAAEGGAAATVTVRLSEAPGRQISIPLGATGANGAAVEDYVVPA